MAFDFATGLFSGATTPLEDYFSAPPPSFEATMEEELRGDGPSLPSGLGDAFRRDASSVTPGGSRALAQLPAHPLADSAHVLTPAEETYNSIIKIGNIVAGGVIYDTREPIARIERVSDTVGVVVSAEGVVVGHFLPKLGAFIPPPGSAIGDRGAYLYTKTPGSPFGQITLGFPHPLQLVQVANDKRGMRIGVWTKEGPKTFSVGFYTDRDIRRHRRFMCCGGNVYKFHDRNGKEYLDAERLPVAVPVPVRMKFSLSFKMIGNELHYLLNEDSAHPEPYLYRGPNPDLKGDDPVGYHAQLKQFLPEALSNPITLPNGIRVIPYEEIYRMLTDRAARKKFQGADWTPLYVAALPAYSGTFAPMRPVAPPVRTHVTPTLPGRTDSPPPPFEDAEDLPPRRPSGSSSSSGSSVVLTPPGTVPLAESVEPTDREKAMDWVRSAYEKLGLKHCDVAIGLFEGALEEDETCGAAYLGLSLAHIAFAERDFIEACDRIEAFDKAISNAESGLAIGEFEGDEREDLANAARSAAAKNTKLKIQLRKEKERAGGYSLDDL